MATLHRLILASGSLGRRELLKQAGYQFEVMPSHIDEHDGTDVTDPRKYVAELAWQKAKAVSCQLSAVSQRNLPSPPRGEGPGVRGHSQGEAQPSPISPPGRGAGGEGAQHFVPSPHHPLSTEHSAPSTLILAADSTVWHQNQIIGKPVDEADARRILSSLVGTTHELWTGVCLWRLEDGLQFCWQEKSDLFFRSLTHDEFEHLITSKVWEGKAGGYGIESVGDPYLTVKTGTISNVIGLPMESLNAVLEHLPIAPLSPVG